MVEADPRAAAPGAAGLGAVGPSWEAGLEHEQAAAAASRISARDVVITGFVPAIGLRCGPPPNKKVRNISFDWPERKSFRRRIVLAPHPVGVVDANSRSGRSAWA